MYICLFMHSTISLLLFQPLQTGIATGNHGPTNPLSFMCFVLCFKNASVKYDLLVLVQRNTHNAVHCNIQPWTMDATQFDNSDCLQIREFYLCCDIVYTAYKKKCSTHFPIVYNALYSTILERVEEKILFHIRCMEYGQHNKHSRKLKCINHEKYAGMWYDDDIIANDNWPHITC